MTEREVEGDFLSLLRARASARPRAIVFPEGEEPRIHEASAECVAQSLLRPVLLGSPAAVEQGLADHGADPSVFDVVDPEDPERVARTLAALRAHRAGRGDSEATLAEMARDPLTQAAVMVKSGEVDGGLAGCVRTTADVVRAALGCIGLRDGIQTLSSSFYMVFSADHLVGPRVLTFTDAGVVPRPDPEQLGEIAMSAATARRSVVGDEPRVAFLSYSTKGSSDGDDIRAVREGVARFRERMPDVVVDGELQGDAALSPQVAERKAPQSPIAGNANVLVFPDLGAANISYKLVQELGGAVALGPVLQGLARPFNDLSRGARASDIVAAACITSLMAE